VAACYNAKHIKAHAYQQTPRSGRQRHRPGRSARGLQPHRPRLHRDIRVVARRPPPGTLALAGIGNMHQRGRHRKQEARAQAQVFMHPRQSGCSWVMMQLGCDVGSANSRSWVSHRQSLMQGQGHHPQGRSGQGPQPRRPRLYSNTRAAGSESESDLLHHDARCSAHAAAQGASASVSGWHRAKGAGPAARRAHSSPQQGST